LAEGERGRTGYLGIEGEVPWEHSRPIRFAFHGQELRPNVRELGFSKVSPHGVTSQAAPASRCSRPHRHLQRLGRKHQRAHRGRCRILPLSGYVRHSSPRLLRLKSRALQMTVASVLRSFVDRATGQLSSKDCRRRSSIASVTRTGNDACNAVGFLSAWLAGRSAYNGYTTVRRPVAN
jgi:hypothetical protein